MSLSLPLHQRILDDIRTRIVSGAWPPGSRIPFEHELAVQYGCSRMTVNKALSELARSGLIERRRKSGSFVARPRSQAAVLEIHDIRTEVEALGLAYAYSLRRRLETPVPTTGDGEGFEAGDTLLLVECLHFAAGAPFCLEERLISLGTVPDAAHESFADAAPGPWLIDHVPWSTAEHEISARNADRHAAGALAIAVGDACLVVERRTWLEERAVTRVRLTYPGAGHSVTARFTPS
jgi:GntR family transcriptional regulator, histidine utilization repressor